MFPFPTFREFDTLRREVDRAFEEALHLTARRNRVSNGYTTGPYPLVNMGEDDEAVYVDVLAPGVAPDKLDISVLANELSIAGEFEGTETDSENESFHRQERPTGKFFRSFTLPSDVNPDDVTASYRDGAVEIRLAKAEAARPKRIAIAAN